VYKVLKDQNKAGSFVNVASIRKDDDGELYYVEENVNDILVRNDNDYRGWLCWAGIESLYIRADGDVFNASCKVHKLGNIYDGFEIPKEPLICRKLNCVCASDLNTSKAIDAEAAKLLRVVNEEK
jgi:hypothetical protein